MLFGLLGSAGVKFNPATDVPDLNGKVILITGGNIGLGKEAILQLSSHNPSRIYLLARTESKATATIEDIQKTVPNAPISYIHCDLTDLSSITAAAKEFVAKEKRLDVLMLNAGIMMVPAGKTKDGYEIQFGTNHVGHALLTKLLMPTLLQTAALPGADVRVVVVSSAGHMLAPSEGIDFASLKTDGAAYISARRYGQSKLANILFASELGRRYPTLLTASLHPGVVDTNLYKSVFSGVLAPLGWVQSWFYVGVKDGAKNQLWAATAKRGDGKGELKTGEYWMPVGSSGSGSKQTRDKELAARLWEWTEKELEGWKL